MVIINGKEYRTLEEQVQWLTDHQGSTIDEYIKTAEVDGNTLTLTDQDDNEIEFTPQGGGSEPAAYIKSISTSGNTLTYTKKDDTTGTYTPNVGVTSVNGNTGAVTGIATSTDLQQGLATRETIGACYTKAESNALLANKSKVTGTNDGTN